MKILVLGGAGFIGRHTVAALLARGHGVVVGTRDPQQAAARLPSRALSCVRRSAHFERLLEPEAWRSLLHDVEVVVNCVGILRPRWGETYDRIHHVAPAALADACVLFGVRRLVHVSALGLHAGAASGFIRSKYAGEQALYARRLDTVIVRPSLLDGAGGYGARWLRRVARWPVHPVAASAQGRIAPLDVGDLADAIAVLCEHPSSVSVRAYELGGADVRTMPEHLMALRRTLGGGPVPAVNVPPLLARAAALLCDALHLTPLSGGHLELLRADNVPQINALPQLLQRAPRRVGVRDGRPPSRKWGAGRLYGSAQSNRARARG